MSVQETHILVVDDLEENRFALNRMLKKSEFKGKYSIAESGDEAWELLQKEPGKYTVVLLDRMMPGMSGMDVLKQMKHDSSLCDIPVIFQTAMAQVDDIAEGLAAGAFYYVTKPYPEKEVFLSIIRSAVEEFQNLVRIRTEIEKTTGALQLMDCFELNFQSLEQVEGATSLIAKACPDPQKASVGLNELLLNAVEHGNAGITYIEKSRLNEADNWKQEVEVRLALEENRNKRVSVYFKREQDTICITIKDEGKGFDWQKYLEIDIDRAFDNHGRGIAMAAMVSFDQLEYEGIGNEVRAVIHLGKQD